VLTERLIENGRAAETPVAVVSWGRTRASRRSGHAGGHRGAVAEAGLNQPAITVVGEVVRLREQLRWYDTRPLHGRRILLTRTRQGQSEIKRLLREEGAEVVELPTQQVVDAVAPEIIGRVADALVDGQYSWVIFSSERAVEMLFRRLAESGARPHATRVLAAGRTGGGAGGARIIADVYVRARQRRRSCGPWRAGLARRRGAAAGGGTQRDPLRGLRAGAVEEVPLYVASVPHQRTGHAGPVKAARWTRWSSQRQSGDQPRRDAGGWWRRCGGDDRLRQPGSGGGGAGGRPARGRDRRAGGPVALVRALGEFTPGERERAERGPAMTLDPRPGAGQAGQALAAAAGDRSTATAHPGRDGERFHPRL
jgi:hypothetical protein